MKTTLIIMAAGIGSRFGTGIKQLAKMSDNGEIIMDYSIYDAKEAGFDKVVFVIRKDIEEEFKAVIGNRIGSQIEVEYVYQELTDLPEGFTVPEGRKKPWGVQGRSRRAVCDHQRRRLLRKRGFRKTA